MSDEKRLIGKVRRDGTLLYETNRWEAGVGSVMRACSMAEREQIAERLKVAANAFEPMRALLQRCAKLLGRVAARPASEVSISIRHTARTLLDDLRAVGVEPKP